MPTGMNPAEPVGRASRTTVRPAGSTPGVASRPRTAVERPGATAGFTVRIDSDESARVAAAAPWAEVPVRPGAIVSDAAAAMAVAAATRRRIVSSMV